MKTTLILLAMIFVGTAANASSFSQVPSGGFNTNYHGALTMKHDKKDEKKIDKNDPLYQKTLTQAKDLEAVLVSTIVEPMFPKGKETELYGGGNSSEIYRSMMIQEYGKILSRGNSLGLAENIAKNLTK